MVARELCDRPWTLAWSSKEVIAVQGFMGVVLVDVATGAKRALPELQRLGTDPVLVFSRDGSKLLFVDDDTGQGWVWDAKMSSSTSVHALRLR